MMLPESGIKEIFENEDFTAAGKGDDGV